MTASTYDQPTNAPAVSTQALAGGGLEISLEILQEELDLDEAV